MRVIVSLLLLMYMKYIIFKPFGPHGFSPPLSIGPVHFYSKGC